MELIKCPKCNIPTDASIFEEHVENCNGNPHGSTCKFCDWDLGPDDEICPYCGNNLNEY